MNTNSVRLIQSDTGWTVETTDTGSASNKHFSLEADAMAWAVSEAT